MCYFVCFFVDFQYICFLKFKFKNMNRFCAFLIILFFCFISDKSYSQTNNTNSQVLQKKSDKWQLINGVKLESGTSKNNLIKMEATTVSSSINSKNASDIPKKKDKNLKPPKVLKYGNKKSSNSIKKEDEE